MVSSAVVQDVVSEVLRAPRRTWAGLGHLVARERPLAVVADRRSGTERRVTPERRAVFVPRWGEVDFRAAARPHVC